MNATPCSGPCAGEVCRRDLCARSVSMTRSLAIVVLYGLCAVCSKKKVYYEYIQAQQQHKPHAAYAGRRPGCVLYRKSRSVNQTHKCVE